MNFQKYLFPLCLFTLFSCQENSNTVLIEPINDKDEDVSKIRSESQNISQNFVCYWDSLMLENGLVNVINVDSTLIVDLKYSSTENFMDTDMYGCLNNCYLQPDVAKKLKLAQKLLKSKNPELNLLIWDGTRPRSVQEFMWNSLKMPDHEKRNFVSDPKSGSLHNFGAAVDLTIVRTKDSIPIDMGTEYDHFSVLAWPIKEKEMLKNNRLKKIHIHNRKLLRKIMSKAGFSILQTEWWHFNSMTRDEAAKKYTIIEGPLKGK